jgi:hypothetical protein
MVDPGNPQSMVAGKITSSGSYTVDPTYTFVSIVMIVSPVAGGNGGYAMAAANNGAWTAAEPGLTSGDKYNVSMMMTVSKRLVPTYIYTPIVVVTVK